jgi:hypothetical protein
LANGLPADLPAAPPGSIPAAPPLPAVGQALLFTPGELVLKELHGLRIEGMTPLEALNRIARWKEELGGRGDA